MCGRGRSCATCPTGVELFDIHAASWVKAAAVAKHLLDPLFAEDALAETNTTTVDAIAPALIAHAKVARSLAQDSLLELGENQRGGEEIAAMLEKQKALLQSTDKYWLVEHRFFSGMAERGTHRYGQKMWDCLPSATLPKGFRDSYTALRALKDSAMAVYCDRAVPSHSGHHLGVVEHLAPEGHDQDAGRRERPSLRRSGSLRFLPSCVHSRCGGPGRAGADRARCSAAHDGGAWGKARRRRGLAFSDLQDLVMFMFLPTAEERKQVNDCTEKHLAATPSQNGIAKKGAKRPAPNDKAVSGYYFKKKVRTT